MAMQLLALLWREYYFSPEMLPFFASLMEGEDSLAQTISNFDYFLGKQNAFHETWSVLDLSRWVLLLFAPNYETWSVLDFSRWALLLFATNYEIWSVLALSRWVFLLFAPNQT